jgi:hypothetical protein
MLFASTNLLKQKSSLQSGLLASAVPEGNPAFSWHVLHCTASFNLCLQFFTTVREMDGS